MNYTIGRRIGSGSFGTVYEAHDERGCCLAAKIVDRADALASSLLAAQFEFLSDVHHDRIAAAVDLDMHAARGPTLILELVDGVDIRTHLSRAGMDSLFDLVLQLLDALRYIHGQGKLHGDLKPDSILVSDEGGLAKIKLVDVGFDFAKGTLLPTIGGTLPYLAPEIIRNEASDPRSDLYSLGAVLYELLSGTRPFDGSSPQEILRKQLEHAPAPLCRVRPDVAPAWDAFVGRLLKKEPIMRYASAGEAAVDLANLFGNPAASIERLSLPRRLRVRDLDSEATRVRRLVAEAGRGGRPLAICGGVGPGVADLVALAVTTAKAQGVPAYPVHLRPGMPALAQILEATASGLPAGSPAGAVESGAPDGGASFAALLAALQAVRATVKVAVLAVDGGEAMAAGEPDLLAEASRRLAGTIAVVVGFHRSAPGVAAVEPGEGFDRIDVPDLTEEGLERTLAGHFNVSALPDGLARELHRITRGDRQTVEMIVRHLWNTGAVKFIVGAGVPEIAWDNSIPLPENLTRMVAGDLAELSPLTREALGLVCLSGGRLSTDALRDFFGAAEASEAVAALVEKGMVEETGGRAAVSLRLDAACEPVLDSLSEAWAGRASRRLAVILESRLAGPGDHYALGLVYLTAGSHQQAFASLVRAGDHLSSFSPGDAILAYGKALECKVDADARAQVAEKTGDIRLARGELSAALSAFEKASEHRLSAMRKRGWVLGLEGDADKAVALLDDCERRAAESGDLAERARVLSDLGYVHAVASRGQEALRILEEARRYFEANGMDFESGIALNRIAIARVRSGDLEPAVGAWREAVARFERVGARRHVGMCLMSLATALHKQMDFGRAAELFGQALAAFEEAKSLVEKARCSHNYALMLVDLGDLSAARAFGRQALDLHTALTQRASAASTHLLLGAIEVEAGNAAEARKHLGLAETGHVPGVYEGSVAKRYLASAEAVAGNRDAALALVDQSFRLAVAAGDADGERQAMLKKAEILLRFGAAEEALDLAARALTSLTVAGSPLLAAVAERLVGEASCAGGRLDEGIESLGTARHRLESAGESLHMARTLRALAVAYARRGETCPAEHLFRRSAEIARLRGARYDYALTLAAAGRAAGERGAFIKARRYLAEAGRIFGTLGISDLERQVILDMDRIGPDETEMSAVTSLSRISQTLNSSHDLTTVLNLAMDLAMEYLGAERGVLMLEADDGEEPSTIVERKMDQESVEEVISISRSIVESVRRTREPVIASDPSSDPRFKDSKSVRIHNVMSVMCVPLMRGESLLGLIYLDNRDVPSDFSQLERVFVEAFANQVALAIENASRVGRLYEDVVDLKVRAGEKYSYANIIGSSKEMQEVFRQVDKAAKSSITVMLTGESGTGKELIAGLLHEQSPRKDRPLIKVNCAAMPRDLLEANLFGIEKNVATGVAARSGFFERADGGTLLLDEIGDMPLSVQTRVLRVLAEREFERVGGSKVLKVDVRLISATNQDLMDLIAQGRFRKDLYFRLNAMRIPIPPLRERMRDLPVLVDHFVKKYAEENSKPILRLSRAAYEILRKYSWPGNVRELETCIEHAVVVADGPEIMPEHLPDEVVEQLLPTAGDGCMPGAGRSLREVRRRVEREWIVWALREAGGVKTRAAELLGMKEAALRKRIKALGISPGKQ